MLYEAWYSRYTDDPTEWDTVKADIQKKLLNAEAEQEKSKIAYRKDHPEDTKIWPDINDKLPEYPPDPVKCDETFEKHWQAYQNEIYEKFRNHVKEQLELFKRKMREDYVGADARCAGHDAATREAQKIYTDAVSSIWLPPDWDKGSHVLRRWGRVDTS